MNNPDLRDPLQQILDRIPLEPMSREQARSYLADNSKVFDEELSLDIFVYGHRGPLQLTGDPLEMDRIACAAIVEQAQPETTWKAWFYKSHSHFRLAAAEPICSACFGVGINNDEACGICCGTGWGASGDKIEDCWPFSVALCGRALS